jgi:acetyl-CoA acyltransferase 1
VKVDNATESQLSISRDDGIRHDVSIQTLGRLKPVFSDIGSSTAGNSSQISDGAAAALMMRRSTAELLGLKKHIIGKWVGTKVIGVRPDEMGIGPAVAIPMLLDSVGLTVAEVGIWEINEAFASQALYCIRKLGIDIETVNPKGGAIALGHPLGATGARQLATLLPEMKRQGQEVGVISMCIGTGMGMSTLIVSE